MASDSVLALLLLLALFLVDVLDGKRLPDIIYAVNCGGEKVVDSVGVTYAADTLTEGIASSFGLKHGFRDQMPEDRELFQTERYGMESFSYTFRLSPATDGEYVISLKFAEVYFQSPKQKVFNVLLNGHPVISELDIFREAGGIGRGVEKIVIFRITGGNLIFGDIVLEFNGELKITFEKGTLDNPKCNAFVVFRGKPSDMPEPDRAELLRQLQAEMEAAQLAMQQEPDVMEGGRQPEEEEEDEESEATRHHVASGPPARNPYDDQDPYESLYPFAIGLAALVPVIVFILRMA